MQVQITTTMGDVVDRLSILQIKHDRRMPINTAIYMELLNHRNIEGYEELLEINKTLWDLEDEIRKQHALRADPGDVNPLKINQSIANLSKDIITWNARRAAAKAQIDESHGTVTEPKDYFNPETQS